MMTGSRFSLNVRAAGMEFVPLPAQCDFDDRNTAADFPEREKKKGLARLRFDIKFAFIDAVPHQYAAVRELLAQEPVDAIMVDFAFAGVAPLLVGAHQRPKVIVGGVIPLTLSSKDTAPFGLGMKPLPTAVGRARNRLLNLLVQSVIFRSSQNAADADMNVLAGRPLPVFFLDWGRLADSFLQFTCPSLEYPRSDLPESFRFVGPVLPKGNGDFVPPPWWDDIQSGRPVVHVTQGTIDNKDPERLLLPTIRSLAHTDVLVVATTAGTTLPSNGLPENARIADFIPYDRLLPFVDVVVTNGGYGGVQRCLAEGLPLIVAGDREDKPEVAARVEWSGAGISLRTGKPKEDAIRSAVQKVLSVPSYRSTARLLSAELNNYDAMAAIERELQA